MPDTTQQIPKRPRGRPRKAPATPAPIMPQPDRNLVTGDEEGALRVRNAAKSVKALAGVPKTLREQQVERRSEHMQVILQLIELGGSAIDGARKVGIDIATPYHWRELHPEFAVAWDAAAVVGKAVKRDEARAEIRRRGVEGVLRPVYQGGKKVGSVREYDGNLLIRHAEMLDPEYRQSKINMEITGANGGPVQVEAVRSRVLGKLASMAGGKVIEGSAE